MIPHRWNEAKFQHYSQKKLKFGYYFDDGVSIASPPVKRAILETVQALQSQGHECVQVTIPNTSEPFAIFAALTSAEGYSNLRKPIGNDPIEPTLRFILTLGGLPQWLRLSLSFITRYLLGDPVVADNMRNVRSKSAAEINQWQSRRNVYREEFNDWFQQMAFDALIAPTSSIPAPKINSTNLLGALAVSTFIYNVLDYPVGVVPVTRVKEGEMMPEDRWKGKEKDGHSWVFLDSVYGKKGKYNEIAKDGVGLPVGVQV